MKIFIFATFAFMGFLISIPQSFAASGDVVGLGARNIGLAQSSLLVNPRSFAAKENPAWMTKTTSGNLGLAYTWTDLQLRDTQANPPAINRSGIIGDDYNAALAANIQNMNFGLTLPIGNRLHLGMVGLMPANGFASVHAVTGNEVYYLLYDDRSQRPELYTSLAMKIPGFDHFSVGAGAFYTFKVEGAVQVGISSVDADARMLMQLEPVYIPYGSVQYSNNGLDVVCSYRAAQKTDAELRFDMNFDVGLGTIPFSGASNLVAFYDPAIFAFGGGYEWTSNSIYLSGKRIFWQNYKAPVVDLSGKDLIALSGAATGSRKVTLQNSWAFSMGYEREHLAQWGEAAISMRLGLGWQESALPEHPTSLAVVDADRLVLAFGGGFLFPRIGQLINKPTIFDIGAQYSKISKKTLALVEDGVLIQSAQVGDGLWTLAAGVELEF